AEHHLSRGVTQLVGPPLVACAECVAKRLFDLVQAEHGQPEGARQARRDRRLARPRRAGDDDESAAHPGLPTLTGFFRTTRTRMPTVLENLDGSRRRVSS